MSRDLWDRWRRTRSEDRAPKDVPLDALAVWLDGGGATGNPADIEEMVADDPGWLDLRENETGSPATSNMVARARNLVPARTKAQDGFGWRGLRALFSDRRARDYPRALVRRIDGQRAD